MKKFLGVLAVLTAVNLYAHNQFIYTDTLNVTGKTSVQDNPRRTASAGLSAPLQFWYVPPSRSTFEVPGGLLQMLSSCFGCFY